jgi:cytochrome P450
MGFDWALGTLPYGEKWRHNRKLMHTHAHSGAVSTYQPVQLASARRLVDDLLHAKHTKHILPDMVKARSGMTTIEMVYGIDVKGDENDEYMATPEKVLQAISDGTVPGRYLVDIFPVC